MDNRDLEAIRADDALIDRLAGGAPVQDADEETTKLLAQLRDEVRADAPEPPTFLAGEEEHRRSRPWAAGFLGAAAASMVIAIGGIAVHQSGVIDGPDDEVIVALSGKLDEAQAASDSGDANAVRRFLVQARSILSGLAEQRNAEIANNHHQAPVTETQTVTAQPEAPRERPEPHLAENPPAPEPETETVTVVSTETVTATVEAPEPRRRIFETLRPDPEPEVIPSYVGGAEDPTASSTTGE